MNLGELLSSDDGNFVDNDECNKGGGGSVVKLSFVNIVCGRTLLMDSDSLDNGGLSLGCVLVGCAGSCELVNIPFITVPGGSIKGNGGGNSLSLDGSSKSGLADISGAMTLSSFGE